MIYYKILNTLTGAYVTQNTKHEVFNTRSFKDVSSVVDDLAAVLKVPKECFEIVEYEVTTDTIHTEA